MSARRPRRSTRIVSTNTVVTVKSVHGPIQIQWLYRGALQPIDLRAFWAKHEGRDGLTVKFYITFPGATNTVEYKCKLYRDGDYKGEGAYATDPSGQRFSYKGKPSSCRYQAFDEGRGILKLLGLCNRCDIYAINRIVTELFLNAPQQ